MGTKGTQEWADWNINVFKNGCPNNCGYCYAKFMALRFKRIASEEEWQFPVINKKVLHTKFKKRKGRGMCFSTHDITPQTYIQCAVVIMRLLQAGNELLITTKPNFNLIKMLCKRIMPYKDQVQFRFTITTMNNEILKKYEPNAPNYESRKDSLIYAFQQGFKTSVSIEPYLDPEPIQLIHLIDDIALYCTESIWIGIMNPKYYKYPYHTYELVKFTIKEVKEVFSIAYPASELPKLRLKDSIRNMGISL